MFAPTTSASIQSPVCSSMDEPTTSAEASNTVESRYETIVKCRRVPESRNSRQTFPDLCLKKIHFIAALVMLVLMPSGVRARSIDVSAKCYFFGPGTTIHGADYRRDYGLSRNECAQQCKSDVCCMGFEFLDGQCTLKSRSLNGTVTTKTDAYFGLCLDFDDADRDNFWDHELGGSVVHSKEKIDREACSKLCGFQEDAIIYSWRAIDEKDSEGVGDCQCIGVLHNVKLTFGAASGFLM